MPRPDDYDDLDARPDRPGVPFPAVVRAAGIIWIGFGVLGLLGAAAVFVFVVLLAGRAGAGGAPAFCAPVCVTLFALVFLMAGIETVKGKAKGILGNAVGSIIFGALYLGQAALIVATGGAAGTAPVILQGALLALLGLALLVAGVLALTGKSAYEDWRKAHGMDWGSRRRRTQEERDYDDEDRPRRRPRRRPYDEDDDRPRRPRDPDDDR